MTFEHPQLLWLCAIPLLLGILEMARRRRPHDEHREGKILHAEARHDHVLLRDAVTHREWRPSRWRFYLAVMFLVGAFARPQWGKIEEPVVEQSREILIAIDLSRSMLAPDIKPTRLERGKLLIQSLLERLKGERVGLAVFSGTAFLQSPLSSDYSVLREFLPELNPEYLPEGGTNYSALLQTALGSFSDDGQAGRYLIVLSDGEATDEEWRAQVEELKRRGIRVIGLGVGTSAGAMIPDSKGGFVKDEQGAVVLSRLEPATLRELAESTGGVYSDASTWVDLPSILQQTVAQGERGTFQETTRQRRVERFQWLLAPACLLFLWSILRELPIRPQPRSLTLRRTPS